jgi:uncharacterized protein YwgA
MKTLDDADIIKFDNKYFNHRLKLQKYVYLANCFKFHTTYNYSLYLHGPYSSTLADDYYAIKHFDDKTPLEIDANFLRLVKGKSEEWLELAATIVMIKQRYTHINNEKLIGLVKTAKPYATNNELKVILNQLIRYGCLA